MLGRSRRRQAARPADFICECCGATVRGGATFCRACGASEESGWGAAADVDASDGYDDFDYDEFVQREFGSEERRPNWTAAIIWLVIAGFVLALLGPLLL